MKKFILYIIVTFCSVHSFGQFYSIFPESQININIKEGEEQTREFYIDNINDSEIWLGWEIVSNSIPSSWGYSLCDNRICYNTVPPSAYMEPIAVESFGFMKLAVWNTSEGVGEISIRIFNEDYAQIDTISFRITHAKPIDAQTLNDTRIFPNPVGADRVIHFENTNGQIKKVEIYNTFGQRILTHKSSLVKINTISLSNFESGIYFFQFLGDNNSKLFTRKVVVK